MSRGGAERSLGSFAQQRLKNKDLKGRLFIATQRLIGQRVDPYANLPEITQHTLTPDIKARAEELANAEKSLPAWQRQGYSRILDQLLKGIIS